MNLDHRLKRLEMNSPNRTPCFCGKTFVDFARDESLVCTHCPKCKNQFDLWERISIAAGQPLNLTGMGAINEH